MLLLHCWDGGPDFLWGEGVWSLEPGLWLHRLFSLPCSPLADGCPGGSGRPLLTIEQGGGLLDGLWDLLQAVLGCTLPMRREVGRHLHMRH